MTCHRAGKDDKAFQAAVIEAQTWTQYARDSYIDPSCEERECDYCERKYRGPAVYCQLACALADA